MVFYYDKQSKLGYLKRLLQPWKVNWHLLRKDKKKGHSFECPVS